MLADLLNYPITVEQPVVWGELDPNGHVNNIWYFRFIENARVALYQRIGKYGHESTESITIVVGSTSCRFKAPLGFGDVVITGVQITSIEEDRFSTAYRIIRKADGVIAAEAEATLVCFDMKSRDKVAIPGKLRTELEALRQIRNESRPGTTALPRPMPSASQAQAGSVFEAADPPCQGERFDTILSHRNLLIERIVSSAAITPHEYVQAQDEWVLMIRGDATLQAAGQTIPLTAGEHVYLPAGVPHSVQRVSSGTIWVAVHLFPEQTHTTEKD